MPDPSGPPDSVGILVPSGMLGAGFSPETITRGIALGADVIAVDGGSTDSGPYYLGTGTAKTADSAVRRDLRLLLAAASRARIPLIVGSCGTSGTDSGVHWVAEMVNTICIEDGLDLKVAKIFSEQHADRLIAELERGRIHALPPSGPLDAATLRRCAHIVAMMGHEPIEQALRAGADVVLAGRATDTAVSAAFALMRGMPPGPTWHAAKIIECGGQCTTNPAAGGVFARIDDRGFTIEPLDEDAACTPASVAAHMLYETVNPYTMREPGGTIEVAGARYTALDERTVRVEGSRFEPAGQYTVKLEGAAVTGYETVSFTGIRDPQILASIDVWAGFFDKTLTERVDERAGPAGRLVGSRPAPVRLQRHPRRAGAGAGHTRRSRGDAAGQRAGPADRDGDLQAGQPAAAAPAAAGHELPAQLRVRHLPRPHRPRRGV